jgi:hypothetical protein
MGRVEPRLGPELKGEPILEEKEPDLDLEWEGGAARRTLSFYHAEGAPYLDTDGKLHSTPPAEEMEELLAQGLVVPPTIVTQLVGEVLPIREESKTATIYPMRAPMTPRSGRTPGPAPVPVPGLKAPMDFSLIEELAFLAIKRVFPEGVRIPIRREGIADLDIIIRGKEMTIDFNTLVGEVPRLAVWRVTFAYQGTPLAVWGRGVKGDIKVHPIRILRLLFRLWYDKRKLKKQALRAAAAAARAQPSS